MLLEGARRGSIAYLRELSVFCAGHPDYLSQALPVFMEHMRAHRPDQLECIGVTGWCLCAFGIIATLDEIGQQSLIPCVLPDYPLALAWTESILSRCILKLKPNTMLLKELALSSVFMILRAASRIPALCHRKAVELVHEYWRMYSLRPELRDWITTFDAELSPSGPMMAMLFVQLKTHGPDYEEFLRYGNNDVARCAIRNVANFAQNKQRHKDSKAMAALNLDCMVIAALHGSIRSRAPTFYLDFNHRSILAHAAHCALSAMSRENCPKSKRYRNHVIVRGPPRNVWTRWTSTQPLRTQEQYHTRIHRG